MQHRFTNGDQSEAALECGGARAQRSHTAECVGRHNP